MAYTCEAFRCTTDNFFVKTGERSMPEPGLLEHFRLEMTLQPRVSRNPSTTKLTPDVHQWLSSTYLKTSGTIILPKH
jgi:hypothetical protein